MGLMRVARRAGNHEAVAAAAISTSAAAANVSGPVGDTS